MIICDFHDMKKDAVFEINLRLDGPQALRLKSGDARVISLVEKKFHLCQSCYDIWSKKGTKSLVKLKFYHLIKTIIFTELDGGGGGGGGPAVVLK